MNNTLLSGLTSEEQALFAQATPDQQAAILSALRAEEKAKAKTAKAVETPDQRDLRLRNAALKAWETRRNLDPTAPSRSAKLAWETRRAKDSEAQALAASALSALKAAAAQALAASAPKAPKAPRKPRTKAPKA